MGLRGGVCCMAQWRCDACRAAGCHPNHWVQLGYKGTEWLGLWGHLTLLFPPAPCDT